MLDRRDADLAAARAARAAAARRRSRPGGSPPGAALPSTRGLAAALGVSRGVVTEAYGQLASEGYLAMRQGAPVRVARAVQRQRPREPARSLLPSFAYDLRPGVPDLAGFPRDAWLRSLRAAWRRGAVRRARRADPRGVPELRETLAAQLARVRGAAADPEHVIVCGGFRAGLSLRSAAGCASTAPSASRSRTRAGIPHRLAIEQAGLDVVPVPGRRARPARRRARATTPPRSSSRPRTSSRPAPCSAASAAPRCVEWAARARRADHRGRLRQRARPTSARARSRGSRPSAWCCIGSREQAARARAAARLDAARRRG